MKLRIHDFIIFIVVIILLIQLYITLSGGGANIYINTLRVLRDGLSISLILYTILKFPDHKLIFIFILAFFITFILTLRSEYIYSSIFGQVRIFINIGFVFIGYYIANRINLYNVYNISIMLSVIFITYFAITATFGIGESFYGSDIKTGYLTGADLYVFSISVLIMLGMIGYNHKLFNLKKYITYVLSAVTIIIMLVIMRRTAIMIIVFGLSYLVLLKIFHIRKVLILIVPITIIMISSIQYEQYIVQQLERRGDIEQLIAYTETARYNEIFITIEYLINNNKLIYGTGNLFEDRETMSKIWRDRRLHGDFSILLFGTGLIGLTIFVLFVSRFFWLLPKSIKSIYGYLGICIIVSYILTFFVGGIYKSFYQIFIMILSGIVIKNSR